MSSPKKRVVVLGAGLMGRLLALDLARRGHAIELYEAGAADGGRSAARVAASMLAPLAESAVTEAVVVRMGQYSLKRWSELIASLPEPVFFQQEGTLIVWHQQDRPHAEQLRRHLQRTASEHPGLPPFKTLDRSALSLLEPALAGRFSQGLLLPGEGQLDNRQLLQALLSALLATGVQLHWNSPRAPESFEPREQGPRDWLIDCRGLGAKPQWNQLRGVRGEVLRVHAPEVHLSRPLRLIHPRYPLYIAPKTDQIFVIGATEIESEDRSPVSVRSTLELMSAAYSVHSGFAEARVLELATQLRPTLPDNLPALRRLGPRQLQVNGLYRHGFLIAPALLDVLVQMIDAGHSRLADDFGLRVEGLELQAAAWTP